jgi:carboxyl-terminal processing protease
VIQATRIICREHVKKLNQGELVDWAIRGLYQRLKVKVPKKIAGRLAKIKQLTQADLIVLLAAARNHLGERKELKEERDIEIAMEEMLRHLDPEAKYTPARDVLPLMLGGAGRPSGVGLRLCRDAPTGMLRVVTPILDSPAYKAGIRAGDLITRIIREVPGEGAALIDREITSTKGLSLAAAEGKIRGNQSPKIILTAKHRGAARAVDVEMLRKGTRRESVFGVNRMANDRWNYLIDREKKIGYVRIKHWSRHTYRDLSRAVAALDKQGLKGLILDLRSCPSGLFNGAVKISGLFIEDGLIASIKPRQGKEWRYLKKNGKNYTAFPMVCLINGDTARSAEVVAACLQDHYRALIIGERSRGDGSIQEVLALKNGGDLCLTSALIYRPSGANLTRWMTNGEERDTWGVVPTNGFALKFSPRERKELMRHQQDQEIILRHDKLAKPKPRQFKDRQLEMALAYFRKRSK